MDNLVYLGLGSNTGDRKAHLEKALRALAERVAIGARSSIYETEPLVYRDQPWFLNMVCAGTTGLEPIDLLCFAKDIENRLGRVPTFPNGPRCIDIDILLYRDRVIVTEELTIPHPRLGERAFVLIPLAEIAPELVHPVSGERLASLMAAPPDSQRMRKWEDVPSVGSTSL